MKTKKFLNGIGTAFMIALAVVVLTALIAIPVYGWQTGDWDLVTVKRAVAEFEASLLSAEKDAVTVPATTRIEKTSGIVVNLTRQDPRPTLPKAEGVEVHFVDRWRIKQVFSGMEDGGWYLNVEGWLLYSQDSTAEGLRAIRAYQFASPTCLEMALAYLKDHYGTSNLFRVTDGQTAKGAWVVVEIVSLGTDTNPRAEPFMCK